MTSKGVLPGMVMIVLSLALMSSGLLSNAGGNSGDSFKIDVNLSKYKLPLPEYFKRYTLPDNYKLDFSNSSIVCPSNNCKVPIKDFTLSINEHSNIMTVETDLKIVDNGSNGHLTPKKRNLIEQSSVAFGCSFSEIQGDILKKTAKYICPVPHKDDIVRNFNSTHYPYTITGSFELPSRHLILNATEMHENPNYFGLSGHVVFEDENGKIQVK